jgi:hypothetical protein
MAENKKSFILYCDQKSVIDMLPDESYLNTFTHTLMMRTQHLMTYLSI